LDSRRPVLDGGPGSSELGLHVASSVEPEVSDLDEAAGKDVLDKSSNEFNWYELAGFLVAGSKGHLVVVDVEDAMVGDVRKARGFRSYSTLRIALFHQLGAGKNARLPGESEREGTQIYRESRHRLSS